MALAFGKQGDEYVRAGHLIAPGGLDVDGGALDHALEGRCRLGIDRPVRGESRQILVKEVGEVSAHLVQVHPAGAEHRYGVRVINQREEEVLKCCIFMPTIAGQCQRTVKRLFKIT